MISKSPWDERRVIDHIQRDASALIGDKKDGSIHIDETGFPKEGTKSAGVAPQYCGTVKDVVNCQVGVFLALVHGKRRTLIDERLYLPEVWANDFPRRREAGIPDEVTFKTKADLALEMILHARDNGVDFAWVGMDSFYGNQPWLLDRLDAEGIEYIADIHCDTMVWIDQPKIGIPEKKPGRGRKPTGVRVLEGEPQAISVEDIAKQLPQSEWKRSYVRDADRGELWTDIAILKVYPRVDGLPGRLQHLILRRDDSNNIKYQLSNAPLETGLARLAQMSHSRYWIERAFQDGKGIAGLADYQIVSWRGWHHHVALSLLAMLMLLSVSVESGDGMDGLTVQDVKVMLEYLLLRGHFAEKEVLRILKYRIQSRNSAKMSNHRN
jgi:SRSO17 transposase